MADIFDKKTRSKIMSSIKSKNTGPEIKLKETLEVSGFLYQPRLPGSPDFVNFRKKIVLFVDGCFWHKCPIHFKNPKTRKKYWGPKLDKNVIRDKEIDLMYENAGWKVLRFWEHEIKSNPSKIIKNALKLRIVNANN